MDEYEADEKIDKYISEKIFKKYKAKYTKKKSFLDSLLDRSYNRLVKTMWRKAPLEANYAVYCGIENGWMWSINEPTVTWDTGNNYSVNFIPCSWNIELIKVYPEPPAPIDKEKIVIARLGR